MIGEPAGGVEDDDVEALAPAGFHGAARDLHGRLAGDDGQRGDLGALAELGELELSGGALGVERGEQHALARAFAQAEADLAGGSGLAGALEADHQDGDRRRCVQVDGHRALAAQLLDHHVVDDLDHLLAGRDRIQHLGRKRALPDLADEVPYNGKGDVGVEQRHADLAEGFAHVGFVQPTAALQAVEGGGELFGERFEHRMVSKTERAAARTFAERRCPRAAGAGRASCPSLRVWAGPGRVKAQEPSEVHPA